MTKNDFTFEGRKIAFRDGLTLAAALEDTGERRLRYTAKDGQRGIFCGMGVCQDCLVTVDGHPNQRACMTRAKAGMEVCRQTALPALETAAQPLETATPEVIRVDVAVVGGGAAGLSAAIAAREAGASVVLLDERKTTGGQYYKQTAGDIAALDTQQAEGADLVRSAAASGARILSGTEIWGAFDGPLLLAETEGSAVVVRPKALVVATGAYERPVMVPGWTLPGVMTTGAAQTLWRSYRTTPGKRVLICGSGPLNAQVAVELAKGGCEIAAILDTAPHPGQRLGEAAAMALADPRLSAKGAMLIAALRRRGIPVRHKTRLLRVDQDAERLRAVFEDARGQETAETVDAVCMNDGFQPQNEILRLLGAEMTYDTRYGHLRCTRDRAMATTVPRLFAAGDCAGLGGAPAARIEGTIAGRAAAAFSQNGQTVDATAAENLALARHRRFQDHLWRVYDPGPQDIDDIAPETMICRCEEITLAEAEDALDAETGHLGTLKRASRIGMGRCQGRYCGPVAARLVARRTGRPIEDFSFFAPRIPIKPVAISVILAVEEVLGGDED